MNKNEFAFPDSTHLEAQVICDCLIAEHDIPVVRGIADPTFFTDPDLREIYEKILSLYDQGKGVDLYSIPLTRNAKDRIIPRLSDTKMSYNGAEVHASMLRTMALQQRLYYASFSLLDDVCNKALDYDDYISLLDNYKDQVFQGWTDSTTFVSLKDSINSYGLQLEDAQSGRTHKIPTSFSKLDSVFFGGFGPGNLIILAARPSVGKTAVALQMAVNAAKNGFNALYFSLEMTKEELTQRILLSTGLISQKDIFHLDKGIETSDFWSKFERSAKEVESLPLDIDDVSSTYNAIAAKIVRCVREKRCDVVFIDYLGLMDLGSKDNIYTRITMLTGKLKEIARRNKVPIVLLCQLNRVSVSEKRPPGLHDLRDSGSIEQDADIVLMLDKQEDDTLAIWVRKNRQGRNDIKLKVRPNESYTTFAEDV